MKQANPEWWIARTFFRSSEPCCVCDESKGDVRIVMDRPHHVECFQRLMRLPQMDLTPVKRALPA